MKKILLVRSYYGLKRTKILMIMRLCIALILFFSLGVSANSYSQQERININKKDISLETLFKEIQNQTELSFVFNSSHISSFGKVSVIAKNKTVKEILDQIFIDSSCGYKFHEDVIIIYPRNKKSSQQKSVVIKGKVVDRFENPLLGATVLIKGTKLGCSTNINGEFTIEIPNNDKLTLIVSFIGFKEKEFTIGNKKFFNVLLEEDPLMMEEVVAIGYGYAKKKDLIGSVSRISSKEINDKGFVNISDALVGSASGVEILSTGGANTMHKIRIRGDANFEGVEPLIVVDGVPMSRGYDINRLSISNIKNIDILKDASSAAIYGSKAAGGVIIITTKRANKSDKIDMSFKLTSSFKELASDVHTLDLDQLKFVYYNSMMNSANSNQKDLPTYVGQHDFERYFRESGEWGDKHYDWPSEMLTNGFSNSYELSMSNYIKSTNYRISFNYDDINGLVEKDYRKSLNIDGQLGFDISKSISQDFTVGFSKYKSSQGASYRSLFSIRPDQPLYDENGEPALAKRVLSSGDISYDSTPLTSLYAGESDGYSYSFSFNSRTTINFLKCFKFESIFSVRTNLGKDMTYFNSKYSQEGRDNNGALSLYYTDGKSMNLENTLTYDKKIKDTKFAIVLGNSYEQRESTRTSFRMKGFPSDKQSAPWQSVGNIEPSNIGGSESSSKSVSFFARGTMTYKNFNLGSTIRMDQSSRFSDKNNKAYFPSIGAAYTFSDLDFWKKHFKSIPFFKIRGSFGLTGNDFVGEYAWRNLCLSKSYAGEAATSLKKLGNEKLRWEKVKQADFGLEFSLLKKSALIFELNLYSKKTEDILFPQKLPSGTGIDGQMYINLATVKNKGLELRTTAKLFRNNTHSLDIRFNLSTNRNKVLDIKKEFSSMGSDYLASYIVTPGQPLGRFYGYVTDGIMTSQEEVDAINMVARTSIMGTWGVGDYKPVDINADGMINEEDRQVLGQSNPDFHGGFTINYTFKKIRFSLTGKYSVGGQRYWKGVEQTLVINKRPKNYLLHVLDTWTPDNNNAKYPMLHYGSNYSSINRGLIDKYIYDASYLKFTTVNVTYDFNRIIKSKIFNQISLNVAVNDLFTITSYPGVNVVSYPVNAIQGLSIDNSSYPRERNYSFSLNLRF